MVVVSNSLPSLFIIWLLASVSMAQLDGGRKKPPPAAPRTPPPPPPPRTPPPPPGLGIFQYYLLALQWPISHCKVPNSKCVAAEILNLPQTFTIHGLWPSNDVGTPISSGEVFDIQIVRPFLGKMHTDWPNVEKFKKAPSLATYLDFWTHEWAEHGAKSGLSQKDYFELTIKLYDEAMVKVDGYFKTRAGTTIDIGQMNAYFANFGVPAAICNNGNNQLWELRFNVSRTGDFQNYTRGVAGENTCLTTVSLPRR